MSDDADTSTDDQLGTDAGVESFAEAMSELEDIVAGLESDSLDVDHLAERVQRAAVLVSWCRRQLDGTRFQVTQILDQLDGPPTGDE